LSLSTDLKFYGKSSFLTVNLNPKEIIMQKKKKINKRKKKLKLIFTSPVRKAATEREEKCGCRLF